MLLLSVQEHGPVPWVFGRLTSHPIRGYPRLWRCFSSRLNSAELFPSHPEISSAESSRWQKIRPWSHRHHSPLILLPGGDGDHCCRAKVCWEERQCAAMPQDCDVLISPRNLGRCGHSLGCCKHCSAVRIRALSRGASSLQYACRDVTCNPPSSPPFSLSAPVNGVPWPQEATRRNSHTFSCRMLIRPPDEPGAENQEARQRYEVMQCFTVSQPKSFKEEGEGRAQRPVLPALGRRQG